MADKNKLIAVHQTRYDWMELKLDYLSSDCFTVQSYLKAKQIPWNGNTAIKTSGWRKEKHRLKTQLVEKANVQLSEKINESATSRAQDILEVITQHKKVGDLCLQRILECLGKNEEVFVDANGEKWSTQLGAKSLAYLAKAARDAVEIQRVSRGITGIDNPTNQDSTGVISARILAVIRKTAWRSGETPAIEGEVSL